MDGNAHFRPATYADLEILLEFMAALNVIDGTAFDRSAARAAAERLIADDSMGNVWLMDVDGRPAGYVILTLGYSIEYGGRDGIVDEIYLAPDARGRGIGREALAFVEDQARRRGVRTLHLEVERANRRAADVYRAAGFVDHDRYLLSKTLLDAS